MTIKSKAHQQFYGLYLTFFIIIGCLLLSGYSFVFVKGYQVAEQATDHALITPLLIDEMKILVLKLDITASFINFYRASTVVIVLCILSLIVLFFRLNRRWKQTYIDHVAFVNSCIKQHQQLGVNNDRVFDEYRYKEQECIVAFFETLDTSLSNKKNTQEPSIANTHLTREENTTEPEVDTEDVTSNEDIVSDDRNEQEPHLSPLEQADVVAHIESLNVEYGKQHSQFLHELQNKIIQVILQNQAEYLTRKASTLGLCNQLNRLLSWVHHNQLVNQITHKETQNLNTPIRLQEQLLACLYNVSLNNKSNKVPVQFFDWLPHLYTIEGDSNRLNSVIINTINLMYYDQRHAHLMLAIRLLEQDEHTCTVNYRFSLFSNQQLTEIPNVVKALLTKGIESHFPVVKQLQLLLNDSNASEVTIEQEDTSYCLSFNLKHKLYHELGSTASNQEPLNKPEAFDYSRLAFNTLYITDVNNTENVYTREIIHNTLSNFNGELILTNGVANALQYLTENELLIHPIDLIVVHESGVFQTLTQHIIALPEALRPKISLLQDTCKYLSEYSSGVTPKLSAPFNKQAFINDILVTMQSNEILVSDDNNELHRDISSENLMQAGYINQENTQLVSAFMTSNIEVLVSICIDSNLMKLLRLMGFNLTITANNHELLTQWKTGKYLILFTNANVLPVVELTNGKQVKRAIFSSNEQAITVWRAASVEQSKSWQIEYLPNTYTLAELKERLSYWFITKESVKIEETKSVIQSTVDVQEKAVHNTAKELIERLAHIDLHEHDNKDDTLDVMNFEEFTLKQISPEFAITLLEEYTQENIHLFDKAKKAISQERYSESLVPLNQLHFNAKVLTADNLLYVVEDVINGVKVAMKDSENNNITSSLQTLEHEMMLMTQYCETI